MLFACSVENAHTRLGVFDEDQLLFESSIATDPVKSADEYAILIASIFTMHKVELTSIDKAIVSSVVRPMNVRMVQVIEQLTQVKPILVGPGVKTGLNIKTDMPSQVGGDIVANAVAAVSLVKGPLVFIDFCTATTLTGINAQGELTGVLISPGVRSALDALSANAAELPKIALEHPKGLFGKNTIDAMTGGTIIGNAAMIDGLLDRIADEWNLPSLNVIATGEYAEWIIPHCRSSHQIQIETNLTMHGLRLIQQLNERHKTS